MRRKDRGTKRVAARLKKYKRSSRRGQRAGLVIITSCIRIPNGLTGSSHDRPNRGWRICHELVSMAPVENERSSSWGHR